MKVDVKTRLIVVKVGTSVLTKDNLLEAAQLKNIVAQVSVLKKMGIDVVLVTSGAIGAGMGLLGMTSRPKQLQQLQAVAAIGQSHLMKLYGAFFKAKHLLTAQVLLTQDDLRDRTRYLNAKHTLKKLLDYNAIPIINENDTVSTEEIRFGDNDRLSSLVANLVEADILIILSDIDGLYSPKTKRIIPTVMQITSEIEKFASDTAKQISVGGMITKLQAAKIVITSGITCVIANGRRPDVLLRIVNGKKEGTVFLPKFDKMAAKKRWIAFSTKPQGRIKVDSGAKEAITANNKSLLPIGILSCEGKFGTGDVISIIDIQDKEFARGIVNYSCKDLDRIKGLKSNQSEQMLGRKCCPEVIHKDNLVVL